MPAGKPAIPVTPRAQGVLWGAGVLQGQPWQAGWCCGCLAHLRLSADLDRGREGSAPPLPPNRTCGFPAYGSPVRGFHIGIELTERGLRT